MINYSDRWILIDRDGVVNHDSDDYIKSLEEWQPIDGSIEALAALSRAGYHIAIITNQSGIARGLIDLDDLEAMHQRLCALVEEQGGHVDAIYYCPHLPEDNCECRKPKVGMLNALEDDFATEISGSPFIGDNLKDLQAAVAKNCQPILVETGKGLKTKAEMANHPEFTPLAIFPDLARAAQALLERK